MTTTATRYSTADRPLTAVLQAVTAQRWTDPSPCEGWSARDVVRHLLESQRDFLTARDIDLGAPPAVDTNPAAAWREHTARVGAVLADESFVTGPFDGYFGPSTVGATFEQFYVWDMLVHRWDIAQATGVDAALSDDELDRIEQGADSFGEALHSDGVCRPGVEASPTDSRQVRVLARLGREA